MQPSTFETKLQTSIIPKNLIVVLHNLWCKQFMDEEKSNFELMCVSTEEYKKSDEMNTDEMNEEWLYKRWSARDMIF